MPDTTRRTALAALAGFAARPALAQPPPFPGRPIRIIAPFTPGGGTDTTARVLAPAMGEFLGQTVLVENRPGAAGSLGAGAVADSPADGYTLLVDALNHVVNPFLLRGLRFDYATAFAPVSLLTVLPQIFVVPPDLPVSTLAEFVDWARARPGRRARSTHPAPPRGSPPPPWSAPPAARRPAAPRPRPAPSACRRG
jgi:tripartite-type tricarboxylate transporter receptor subunit TctC